MIAQLKSNAVEAFDLLIEQYGDRLYWHIRRMVVQHEEAEDVLQEMWIKVYAAIEGYRGDADGLRSWCYRIATNTALDRLRQRCRWKFVTIDGVGRELSEELMQQVGESAESIEVRFQRALLSLPTKQRLVFNLKRFPGIP